MRLFSTSNVMKPFLTKSLGNKHSSVGITPSKKSCSISRGNPDTGWKWDKCLWSTQAFFTPLTVNLSLDSSSSTKVLCCSTVLSWQYLASAVLIWCWLTRKKIDKIFQHWMIQGNLLGYEPRGYPHTHKILSPSQMYLVPPQTPHLFPKTVNPWSLDEEKHHTQTVSHQHSFQEETVVLRAE